MNDHLEIAILAVQKAEIVCRLVQETFITSVSKDDRSPVTVADFAAQAIVSIILKKHTPEIPLVGEEDATLLRNDSTLRAKVCRMVHYVFPDIEEESILTAIDRGTFGGGSKGAFWVLDPIDGTKGFLRKQQYAIALGLVDDGVVQTGVLGCPNLPRDLDHPEEKVGALFFATKGKGAFRWTGENQSLPISVSATPFRFCESVEKGHSSHSRAQQIADLVGITEDPIRMDSQCKYALVAQGQAAAYLRLTKPGYIEKIWDHAAGALIVVEAGGCLTDIYGIPLDFSKGRTLRANKGVIASYGQPFHQELVTACGQTTTTPEK
jgi:HAL2 family 3'(2'),5'-bisphosphate nucleotidase